MTPISREGQSIFEYIIFLTAVILVLLVFLGTNGFFKKKLESSLNQAVNSINVMVDKINFESQ